MKWYFKIFLFVLVILFIRSVIHDLSVGTAIEVKTPSKTEEPVIEKNRTTGDEGTKNNSNSQIKNMKEEYVPVSYKVKAGDTVLSIAEELNKTSFPIQKLLEDFQKLNPNTNPHQIIINKTYFFPVYNKE